VQSCGAGQFGLGLDARADIGEQAEVAADVAFAIEDRCEADLILTLEKTAVAS
jgi:hypothetical protein